MKRASLISVFLVVVSVMAYAGSVITNDTGEDVTGLRVTFSQQSPLRVGGSTNHRIVSD